MHILPPRHPFIWVTCQPLCDLIGRRPWSVNTFVENQNWWFWLILGFFLGTVSVFFLGFCFSCFSCCCFYFFFPFICCSAAPAFQAFPASLFFCFPCFSCCSCFFVFFLLVHLRKQRNNDIDTHGGRFIANNNRKKGTTKSRNDPFFAMFQPKRSKTNADKQQSTTRNALRGQDQWQYRRKQQPGKNNNNSHKGWQLMLGLPWS